MPNIAQALKGEISRVARKEVRSEIAAMKRAASQQRAAIAQLKRQVQELERQLRHGGKPRSATAPKLGNGESAELQRFSAKGFATHRRRLGLSAGDYGLLIGTSAQSVRNWEEGKARPRAKYLPAVAALRTLGKREATKHLESLRGTTP